MDRSPPVRQLSRCKPRPERPIPSSRPITRSSRLSSTMVRGPRMSNFKPRTKTRTKKVRAPLMIVDGPPGVEIQIIDGNYHVQARGTEQVKQRLPEGVYIVKWIRSEERRVGKECR